MGFRPLYGRIVVKRDESDEKSSGGIILVKDAQEKPQKGLVLAIGEGRLLQSGEIAPVKVSVGDKILFAKFSGAEVNDGTQKVLIMHEEDVLAVIEE